MKKYLLFLSFFAFSPAWAQKIWINAPESFASSAGDKTYVDFIYEKIKSAPLDEALLSWSQSVLEKEKISQNFFNELSEFEANRVTNSASREVIVDLLTKLIDRATATQKNDLQRATCHWLSVDSHLREKSTVACKELMVSLRPLQEKFPALKAVLLEDILLTSQELGHVKTESGAIYNWKLLSNSQKMISFRGTSQELLAQYFVFNNLVEGSCESFTHQIDDIELVSRGMVYFSPDCQKSLAHPDTSLAKEWYEKNRPWIIPAAVVILGAVAYQLKDKKIVIDKSAFK